MLSEDPITAIMAGSAVVGTGMSAYGQWQAGEQQKVAYDYNADVARRNAKAAEQASREEWSQLEGAAKSGYGKGNIEMSSGSPLLHLKYLRKQGEKEALGIRYAGMSQAEMMRLYGDQAQTSGRIGAISSLFSGLGQTGMQMYGGGMFPSTRYNKRTGVS